MSEQWDGLLERLKSIKDKYGDKAYQDAARDVARSMVAQGGEAEKVAREAFADVPDIEPTGNDAEMPVLNPVIGMIRQTMPNLRTQAQLDTFMATFDALRAAMDAIFQGAPGAKEAGLKAMEQGFEAACKATEISGKLRDVPEAATSASAEAFKTSPKEFEEVSVQKALMAELAGLQTLDGLKEWYAAARPRMDRVVAPALRNELFDAIRHRKDLLP